MKSLIKLSILLLFILSCDNSINKQLRDISNELNKMCPMVVDKYSTLMNTGVIDENLMYSYKFNIDYFYDNDISKSEWKESQSNYLTNFYCTEPDFHFYRENNINVIWRYSELNGSYFDEIELNMNNCNN